MLIVIHQNSERFAKHQLCVFSESTNIEYYRMQKGGNWKKIFPSEIFLARSLPMEWNSGYQILLPSKHNLDFWVNSAHICSTALTILKSTRRSVSAPHLKFLWFWEVLYLQGTNRDGLQSLSVWCLPVLVKTPRFSISNPYVSVPQAKVCLDKFASKCFILPGRELIIVAFTICYIMMPVHAFALLKISCVLRFYRKDLLFPCKIIDIRLSYLTHNALCKSRVLWKQLSRSP